MYIYVYVCVHRYIMVQSSGFGFRNALSCLVCLSCLRVGVLMSGWVGLGACLSVNAHRYVGTHLCVFVCMYAHTQAYTYIHAYKNECIHIYVYMRAQI